MSAAASSPPGLTQNVGRCAGRHCASSDFTVAQSLLPTGRTGFALFVGRTRATGKESASIGKQRSSVMQKIRSASGLPSTVYWVVTGLVRTQRLQNSPPRISRRTARARSAPSARTLPAPPPEFPPTVHRMAALREISSVELRSLIMSSAPKSCELDSLPAFLIQDYVDDLLPFLTLLCNRSLQEGVLPDSQKRSVIFPALKLDGLDLKDPSNFRPISNVSFLSKIIEKIVSEQITPYLSTNDLLPKYQSGFRRGHSIETLLLRLLSDCYGAIDGGRVTLFALFDVSAAFDTIDHQSPLCLFWTLWPSSRLDYVFLGWALQLRGVGNKPVPMGPRSIWSSSRFCPGSLTISTLHF